MDVMPRAVDILEQAIEKRAVLNDGDAVALDKPPAGQRGHRAQKARQLRTWWEVNDNWPAPALPPYDVPEESSEERDSDRDGEMHRTRSGRNARKEPL